MKTHRTGSAILAVALSALLVASGCNLDWMNTAISDIPVVLQIVSSILGIVAVAEGKGQADPAVVAEVKSIGAQATSDLTAAQNLINDYKVASATDKPTVLGKIDAALSAAQKDLQGILAAFHVKDTATQTAISVGVGLALTTVEAITSLLPLAPSPAMPTARKVPPHKPDNPADLKTKYNAIVASNFPDAVIH